MKKIIVFIAALVLISVFMFGCSSDDAADLVVFGNIYTAEDENDSTAEAFAVKDGRYVYVGDAEGVEQYIQEGKTEVLDRTDEGLIIPGCTEGHSHYFGIYGVSKMLPGYKCSYEELLKIVGDKYKKEKNEMKQFISFGIEPTELGLIKASGVNFADELEKAAPGVPIVLIDDSGHNAVCSKTVLQKTGLLKKPEIRGGEVYLDSNGNPSGYVGDQAVSYVIEKTIASPLTDNQYEKACISAVDILHKEGYTNAMDAWINIYDDSALIKKLKEMDDSGELTINVTSCYNIKSYDAENYKEKVNFVSELSRKYKSTHSNPGYIKLFADGMVEAGTGWIIDEYKNAAEGKEHGNKVWEPKELEDIVEYANRKDILVHTHSFGDGACKATLDAYIASNKSNGGEYRNCLGHVRNIRAEDIKRAADNKIPIAENIIWHTDYDESKPENLITKRYILSNVPENMYYSGYPMKSLIKGGATISSSTDAPVTETIEGNIMNVLEVAVTGIGPQENNKAFAADELLTVREGLEALTINGAWQLGLEKERGSVKEGKYADFVVLDKNILDYEGEQLRSIGDTKILNTYFEGEKVYTAR